CSSSGSSSSSSSSGGSSSSSSSSSGSSSSSSGGFWLDIEQRRTRRKINATTGERDTPTPNIQQQASRSGSKSTTSCIPGEEVNISPPWLPVCPDFWATLNNVPQKPRSQTGFDSLPVPVPGRTRVANGYP
ncbi:unnamed protein product, partial [Lampetra planeri]